MRLALVIGNRNGVVIHGGGISIVRHGWALGMPWHLCLKRRAWQNLFWLLRKKAGR